jgi:hypothetical protein
MVGSGRVATATGEPSTAPTDRGDREAHGVRVAIARWWWVLVAAFLAVVFFRTMFFGLYWDDQHHARPWTWSEVAGTFHGPFDPLRIEPDYFRPLVVVSFAVDWTIWGFRDVGYHITNVVLHIAVALGAGALVRRLHGTRAMAATTAIVFGLWPLAATTAIYISQRSDAMVAGTLVLGSLALVRYHRTRDLRWLAAVAACTVVGLFTKEIGTAAPFVHLSMWWYLELDRTAPPATDGTPPPSWAAELRAVWSSLPRRSTVIAWVTAIGPSFVIVGLYSVYRRAVLPDALSGVFGTQASPPEALVTGVVRTWFGVPLELRWWQLVPALILLVAVALVLVPRSRHWRLALLGVAWTVAGVIPLTYNGGTEPRLLYVATIGVALIAAAAIGAVADGVADGRVARRTAIRAMVPVLALGSVLLVVAQFQAQQQFAPGSQKKLEADLNIWTTVDELDLYEQRYLDAIEQRLLDAGLINPDGSLAP